MTFSRSGRVNRRLGPTPAWLPQCRGRSRRRRTGGKGTTCPLLGRYRRCAYNSTLMQLRVQIVRYVDDHFPGFVECELVDASGRIHTFVEKGPVVSDKWPSPDDSYPMSGEIRCEILEQWHCPDGRDLLRVTTEQPDYVETKDGVLEFVVLSSQVISAEATIAETERKAQDCEDRAKSEPSRAEVLLREAASYRDWIASLKRGHWRS